MSDHVDPPDPLRLLKGELSTINTYFHGHAEILSLPRRIMLQLDERAREYQPTALEMVEAQTELNAIGAEPNKENEWHGLLSRPIPIEESVITLHFCRTHFDVIRAKRNLHKQRDPDNPAWPAVLSASAVVVCPETHRLVFHERSRESDTYPCALHTFGGAFQPSALGDLTAKDVRDHSLAKTFKREFTEESDIHLRLFDEEQTLTMLSGETTTGFIQYVFLGLQVDMVERNEPNWEGQIRIVSFDQLESLLLDWGRWVPSGRMHVLAWLAAGAPGSFSALQN